MTEIESIAAQLETEAATKGWPKNHLRMDFLTPGGNQAMALVTITIGDVAPTIADDFAETMPNTSVDIDVLANDSDPLGRPLRIVSVQSPTALGGTAVILPGETHVRYTPPTDIADQVDTFTYEAAVAL